MRCLFLYLSAVSADDPKRPAGAGTSAGLVQNDGQVPDFLTAPVTGGIGHEDLFILHTAQNDEMAGGSKVPLGHQRNHQFAVSQGIQNALWFRSGTPFNGKSPRLCCAGDQSVVGAAFAAPIAMLIGPPCHLCRVNRLAGYPFIYRRVNRYIMRSTFLLLAEQSRKVLLINLLHLKT